MSLSELSAISPIDGRYKSKTTALDNYFSEYALFKYRVRVEVEYFIALCQMPLPQLSEVKPTVFDSLRDIYRNFSEEDAKYIKSIERTTNHDVKAVEYFLKERCEDLGLADHLEFIHFGLTSQDINNTAIPLSIKEAIDDVIMPELNAFRKELLALCKEWKDIPMLAKTHGQPASPTRLGKELYVFVERIEEQINLLTQIPVAAKFGGATGNFNAHVVAYPDVDWVDFGNNFLNDYLELDRTQTTTQIEHYDHFAATADVFKRINNIMIDFSRDVWTYISMDYFKQKLKEGEVGSSAMPHKVNPIDFENAEGNLGIANALFEHFAAKLPISRLQRDLTDSTVLRNVGVPFGHMMIALASLRKGVGKLLLNEEKINEDLEKNWAVVAEAIQTILRRESYPKPYEALKALTRGNSTIDREAINEFIKGLDISDSVKQEMLAIKPQNYTGVSPEL